MSHGAHSTQVVPFRYEHGCAEAVLQRVAGFFARTVCRSALARIAQKTSLVYYRITMNSFRHTLSVSGALLSVGCALLLPLITNAHTTEASWNVVAGEYTIDLGYDPVAIVTGSGQIFNFILWKGSDDTGTQVGYSHVWVRILRDNDTLLATGIAHQSIGPTTLLYTFDMPGAYTLEASFRNADGEDIASATFPIAVTSAQGSVLPAALNPVGIISLLCGLLLGFVLAFFFVRRRARTA